MVGKKLTRFRGDRHPAPTPVPVDKDPNFRFDLINSPNVSNLIHTWQFEAASTYLHLARVQVHAEPPNPIRHFPRELVERLDPEYARLDRVRI